MLRQSRTFLLALLALLVPAALTAQQQSPPPPEVQALMLELQQVQAQLAPLQQQALQDSAIQAEQEEVSGVVRDAMVAADPTVEQKLTRLEALMAEARTAQQAGDTERIAALTSEAQTLQPAIIEAQTVALARPEVEARIATFQTNLRNRMLEIDPESRPLLDRQSDLEQRIRAALEGGRVGADAR